MLLKIFTEFSKNFVATQRAARSNRSRLTPLPARPCIGGRRLAFEDDPPTDDRSQCLNVANLGDPAGQVVFRDNNYIG